MKHLLIALLILALCLSFCLWAGSYIRRTVAEPLNALRLARTHAENGDFARAQDAVEQAMSLWQQREAVYCMLLHHDETDCVLRDFAALHEQAQTYADAHDLPGYPRAGSIVDCGDYVLVNLQ